MPSNEIVHYQNAPLDQRKDYARTLASADDMLPKGLKGIVRDANGNNVQAVVPGKLLLLLETGRMLGVDPMAALQGINVIEGKASIAPALMTALVRRAGHKIRVDVTGSIETGDIQATAKLTRSDEPDEPYLVTWTIADAIRAQLVDSYEPNPQTGLYEVHARSKENNPKPWETYTRSMLKWRALGEVVRDGAEDILMGVHYTPEELGAIVDEDGQIEPETVAQFKAAEDAAIARIQIIDDKLDMETLWQELHSQEIWTPRVEAVFAEYLAKCSKDSRPPKAGAPGNTGIPSIDEPMQSAPAPTERPESPEETRESALTPDPEAENVSDGRTGPGEEIAIPVDEDTEEQRDARIEHENYLAALAEESTAPADDGLFNGDALKRTPGQR